MPLTSKPSPRRTPNTTTSKAAPPQVLAALAKFEEAKRALHKFIEKNRKITDAYDTHRDAYNSALTEMQSLYKQYFEVLGPSFGGFTLQKKREINKELLFKLLPGIKEALEVDYKINVSILDKLMEDEIVPEDIAEQVVYEVPHQIRGASKL
jgi:hypothetical protein